jgi:hypothetical protein
MFPLVRAQWSGLIITTRELAFPHNELSRSIREHRERTRPDWSGLPLRHLSLKTRYDSFRAGQHVEAENSLNGKSYLSQNCNISIVSGEKCLQRCQGSLIGCGSPILPSEGAPTLVSRHVGAHPHF